MDSRDEYVRRMKARLDEWNSEIDTLVARAGEITAELSSEYRDQIYSLKSMLAGARQKLEDLQQVGEIAWEILKSGVDLAWVSLEEAIAAARSRFHKH